MVMEGLMMVMSFGESENDVPELLFLALNPNPALHLTRR